MSGREAQVFVDDSGRRARCVHLAGFVLVGACAFWLVALTLGMVGFAGFSAPDPLALARHGVVHPISGVGEAVADRLQIEQTSDERSDHKAAVRATAAVLIRSRETASMPRETASVPVEAREPATVYAETAEPTTAPADTTERTTVSVRSRKRAAPDTTERTAGSIRSRRRAAPALGVRKTTIPLSGARGKGWGNRSPDRGLRATTGVPRRLGARKQSPARGRRQASHSARRRALASGVDRDPRLT
jgi:hypothetical protein